MPRDGAAEPPLHRASGIGRLVRYAWPAPWTLVACALAPAVRRSGGSARLRDGVVELEGGVLARLLPRLGFGWRIAAMTLGHVVLATDQDTLDRTRAHERVHVRQYERWGPFFPLVYGLASVVAWLPGGDPYLDNRFEREARRGGG